jgi:hypothetical protein
MLFLVHLELGSTPIYLFFIRIPRVIQLIRLAGAGWLLVADLF